MEQKRATMQKTIYQRYPESRCLIPGEEIKLTDPGELPAGYYATEQLVHGEHGCAVLLGYGAAILFGLELRNFLTQTILHS